MEAQIKLGRVFCFEIGLRYSRLIIALLKWVRRRDRPGPHFSPSHGSKTMLRKS